MFSPSASGWGCSLYDGGGDEITQIRRVPSFSSEQPGQQQYHTALADDFLITSVPDKHVTWYFPISAHRAAAGRESRYTYTSERQSLIVGTMMLGYWF